MGFFRWHEATVNGVQKWLGLSNYQLLWWAWIKGLMIGGIIVYFYMR